MELTGQSQRWQGQRSAYSWEQSALEHIKAQMPDAEPYRAWQTFTFTAATGHVREVDLLIATPERESQDLTGQALRAWTPPQAQRGRRV